MMANLHTSIREPAPEPAPARAPRQKKEVVEHISPETSDTSDSGSESEYEEVNKIKSYFEQEPCEAISPAALGQTKTKKEALAYLKSKNCPKIPNIKRSAKSIKMESGPASPAPEVAPTKKRVAKPKAAAAPVPAPAAPAPAPEPVPELKVVKKRTPKVKAPEAAAPAAAPSQGTPLASAPAAPEKKKRAPSAYASLVGKLVKEKKMSFGEAAKAAKAELDAKKKKD
jgi:2-oxoglutarate dehydrogenase E2 component (dihydrolipoamide succinyltransferase)